MKYPRKKKKNVEITTFFLHYFQIARIRAREKRREPQCIRNSFDNTFLVSAVPSTECIFKRFHLSIDKDWRFYRPNNGRERKIQVQRATSSWENGRESSICSDSEVRAAGFLASPVRLKRNSRAARADERRSLSPFERQHFLLLYFWFRQFSCFRRFLCISNRIGSGALEFGACCVISVKCFGSLLLAFTRSGQFPLRSRRFSIQFPFGLAASVICSARGD